MSAARFGVSAAKGSALEEKMAALGIREDDLEEQFVRSGGHGGQNVNKVSTCVLLRHIPSGIVIRAQEERSQSINRYLARKRLADKIEALKLGRESEERKRIEKIRRQKRRRSRRAKNKMLDDKRHQSQKKASRGRVTIE